MVAPRGSARIVVLLALLALSVWGCAPDGPDDTAAAPTPAVPAPTATAPERPSPDPADGAPTPEPDAPAATSAYFHGEVATVDGEELDLSVFAGRDVAVWFWAPW